MRLCARMLILFMWNCRICQEDNVKHHCYFTVDLSPSDWISPHSLDHIITKPLYHNCNQRLRFWLKTHQKYVWQREYAGTLGELTTLPHTSLLDIWSRAVGRRKGEEGREMLVAFKTCMTEADRGRTEDTCSLVGLNCLKLTKSGLNS